MLETILVPHFTPPPPPPRVALDLRPLNYAVVNKHLDFGYGYRCYAMFADLDRAQAYVRETSPSSAIINISTGHEY